VKIAHSNFLFKKNENYKAKMGELVMNDDGYWILMDAGNLLSQGQIFLCSFFTVRDLKLEELYITVDDFIIFIGIEMEIAPGQISLLC
jgi:hypothetical protein